MNTAIAPQHRDWIGLQETLDWDADLVIALCQIEPHPSTPRRRHLRRHYRTEAHLALPGASQIYTLFVRDISAVALGFVTQSRLPLRWAGTVSLIAPSGRLRRMDCTVLRCRQVVSGWYEGALLFAADQRDIIEVPAAG